MGKHQYWFQVIVIIVIMIIFVRDVGGTHRNVTFQNSSFDNKKTGYGAENALQGGGQVSTRRHVCRWCPFFRLGFRFLPHVPTTPRTYAPLLHHPFTAFPLSTLHHIHIPLPPHPPPMNSSVTDDIFVAAILAAICSAFSALAPENPLVQICYCGKCFIFYLLYDWEVSVSPTSDLTGLSECSCHRNVSNITLELSENPTDTCINSVAGTWRLGNI